ncbi:MAG: VOC family protein [Phycisphaerae bacterium]
MQARLFRVVLPVFGIDAAARFYGAVLGVPGKRVSPGRHYFACGNVVLACVDASAEGEVKSLPPNPEHIYFAVDDLEAVHRACVAAGGDLQTPSVHGEPGGVIAKRPWGERSFYCIDPFGNPICFVDQRTTFTG